MNEGITDEDIDKALSFFDIDGAMIFVINGNHIEFKEPGAFIPPNVVSGRMSSCLPHEQKFIDNLGIIEGYIRSNHPRCSWELRMSAVLNDYLYDSCQQFQSIYNSKPTRNVLRTSFPYRFIIYELMGLSKMETILHNVTMNASHWELMVRLLQYDITHHLSNLNLYEFSMFMQAWRPHDTLHDFPCADIMGESIYQDCDMRSYPFPKSMNVLYGIDEQELHRLHRYQIEKWASVKYFCSVLSMALRMIHSPSYAPDDITIEDITRTRDLLHGCNGFYNGNILSNVFEEIYLNENRYGNYIDDHANIIHILLCWGTMQLIMNSDIKNNDYAKRGYMIDSFPYEDYPDEVILYAATMPMEYAVESAMITKI